MGTDGPAESGAPQVTVVLVTRHRPADLRRCLASVVGQTVPAQIVVLDNSPEPGKEASVLGAAVLLRSEEFLGPADAKNIAFQHAAGPLVVLLDDDAELARADALERIVRVFAADPQLGCLALNCLAVQADGGQIEQMARLRAVRPGVAPLRVAGEPVYAAAEFVGAGCAFRLGVFRAVGGFPAGYGYGYEEPHLAYRILDAGWTILYARAVEVRHYHSISWRLPAETRLASQLRNKWTMSAQLFPAPWIPLALVPFTLRTLLEMREHRVRWGPPLRWAWSSFRQEWRRRRPLSPSTVRLAMRLRGRL